MVSYKDFVIRIEMGMAYRFRYRDNYYAISSVKDKYLLYPYINGYDGSMDQEFTTAEELFLHARIDGKSIDEIWDHVDRISIC